MNYLRQSNREQQRNNRPTVIVATILGCFILVHIIFPRFFTGLLLRVLTPLLAVQHQIQIIRDPVPSDLASSSPETLRAEISLLREENTRLKEMFGRQNTHQEILAAVLSVPPQSPYDTIIIDAGSAEGIQVNKDVYASSTLIGRVVDVYEHSSKVVLFSSPDQTYEVLLGKDSVRATAIGKGGGVYEAIVPREFKIVPGDPVTIPALYEGLFGVVEYVTTDPARAFVAIYFKTPINIQQMRWVTVKK
ncbi:MAG: rod shape-determining protein MreC [Candidatus Taylorbacteria bacterium]|nr:rod shape-determining protein MreC [Candidatus Taylorbacteria bacterium]